MDRNNYIEIHPTQAEVTKISYHHPSKYINIEGKIGKPTVIRTSSFINSLYHFERIPGNIHGAYVSLESEIRFFLLY
jgi:hypothetical protein